MRVKESITSVSLRHLFFPSGRPAFLLPLRALPATWFLGLLLIRHIPTVSSRCRFTAMPWLPGRNRSGTRFPRRVPAPIATEPRWAVARIRRRCGRRSTGPRSSAAPATRFRHLPRIRIRIVIAWSVTRRRWGRTKRSPIPRTT